MDERRKPFATFQADARARARGERFRNSTLAAFLLGLVFIIMTPIWFLPIGKLEIAAVALLLGGAAVAVSAVWMSYYRAQRGRPPRCSLSDWGVEFDAPPNGPRSGDSESGGALQWEDVGEVRKESPWPEKKAGLAAVSIYPRGHVLGAEQSTWARFGLWRLYIPYLRDSEADALIRIIRDRTRLPSVLR